MKLISWYDNEWGYRYNLSHLILLLAAHVMPVAFISQAMADKSLSNASCSNRVLDLIEHMALVAAI